MAIHDQESRMRSASYSGAEISVQYRQVESQSRPLQEVVKSVELTRRNRMSLIMQSSFDPIQLGRYSLQSIPIHGIIELDGRLVVRMPYIHGVSCRDLAISGDTRKATVLSGLLNLMLTDNLRKATIGPVEAGIFLAKIESIMASARPHLVDRIRIQVDQLARCFSDRRTLTLPIGPYHGDLTLSNLLYEETTGTYYIFDFLKSFIDSPLLDYAKWRQDAIHAWSFRTSSGAELTSGLLFAKAATPEFAVKSINDEFFMEAQLLSAMNLLRITPYLKTATDEDWLVNRLQYEVNQAIF